MIGCEARHCTRCLAALLDRLEIAPQQRVQPLDLRRVVMAQALHCRGLAQRVALAEAVHLRAAQRAARRFQSRGVALHARCALRGALPAGAARCRRQRRRARRAELVCCAGVGSWPAALAPAHALLHVGRDVHRRVWSLVSDLEEPWRVGRGAPQQREGLVANPVVLCSQKRSSQSRGNSHGPKPKGLHSR